MQYPPPVRAMPSIARRIEHAPGMPGIHQTLSIMRRFARAGSSDPAVRHVAAETVRYVPAGDRRSEAWMVGEWVRHNIRFVRDPIGTETVSTPAEVLRVGYGDCDDASTLIAAMLRAIGIRAKFVAIGPDARGLPQHVYTVALTSPPIALDTAPGLMIGQQWPGVRRAEQEV